MKERVLVRIAAVVSSFAFVMFLCQPSFAATKLAPTADSWNQGPVASELQQIHWDAFRVSNIASDVQSLNPVEVGWRIYAANMNRIRSRVNSMNAMLRGLRTDVGDVSPAERTEIKEITPSVIDLAAATSASIKSVDKYQAAIALGHMRSYATDLYDLSAQVSHTTGS